MRFISRILLSLVLLVSAAAASAAETGSISGDIKDSNGLGVPGATVKVSGPLMPAGRQVVSSGNGAFNFQKLIPGTYKIEAELTGLGRSTKDVTVSLDSDTQVTLSLTQKATAEVTVTAEAVSVDLKSAEVNTSFGEKELRALPLTRNYSGLLQLIPGGSVDPNFGNGFNAGGTIQDNMFLIDGVNISNPFGGYLSIETNELDISEFNVKRGGINAETRAVGAVINAITKSGTNNLQGAVRIEAQPKSFSAKPVSLGAASTTDRYVPAVNLGFPIMKDQIFGYVSGRWRIDNTTDRSNFYGPLPDGKYNEQEYHAKITAYPNQQNFVSVDGRYLPQKTTNGYDSLLDQVTRGYDQDNKDWTVSAAWNYFVGANTNVEAKYIHLTEQNQSLAQNNIGLTPTWNPTNIYANGSFTDPVGGGTGGVYSFRSNIDNFKRDEVRLTASQFLDLGPTQHQFKGGAGVETTEEDLTRLANGWGDISTSTATAAGQKASYRARWYPDQSTQLSPSRTITLFLQDTITWKRLSATLGFMVNRDEYAQEIGGVRNNFLTFRFGQEFQPRLGIVYNADLLKGDKFYGNYGKYMDLNQKSSARSLAPFRIYQLESYFDAAGNLLLTQPRAATTGKTIDGGLKPTYLEEFLAGYSAPIGSKWSFDTYYQYRRTEHFIEDIPGTFPSSGPFHVSNLDRFGASRLYRAFTVEVQKRYADKWAFDMSYTYSRFEGNFDLEYSATGGTGQATFNTSSNLMDGQGWYVYDPNRYGLLGTDRPHIFKAFGSYDLFGVQVGGALRVQSGRAYEARGADPVSGFVRYIEPAGSRRNPTWTNFDLLAAYHVPVGPVNLRLEGRILNLFNTQTVLTVNRTEYLDAFVSSTTPPLYAGPQGTTKPNPSFLNPTSYAQPRRFVASITAEF
jgi:carboxypeptidase family protein